MNRELSFIGGIGLGAGLMYLLDPDRGRRRRALVRDRAKNLANQSEEMLAKTARDLTNRARGIATEAKSLLRNEPVSDEVLLARVRSKLGRLVSHPGAIKLDIKDGVLTLRGPVLASEVDDLLKGVAALDGVSRVQHQLDVHKQAGDVPGLQGGPPRRPRETLELLQTNWSPAARFLVSLAGGTLAVYGARQRNLLGGAMSALGAGLLARAITNKEFKRLTGVRAGRRAVDVRKTININAPLGQVFEFWANYENFPRFMSHLREVREIGRGRSRWTAAGPAGMPMVWEAEITELAPNEVLAWKSVPGSTIENAGIIRFKPNPDGSTTVDIQISYNPPAGAVGHAIARLFGTDPEAAMNEDLVRLKSLLEVGKTRSRGETVTRDQLEGVARSLVPTEPAPAL